VAVGAFLVATLGAILRSQLYGVSALNPFYLGLGALLTAAITLVAASVPALRATGVDPVRALRQE